MTIRPTRSPSLPHARTLRTGTGLATFALLVAGLLAGATAAGDAPRETDDEDPEAPTPVLRERVTVTADRLPAGDEGPARTPANVTVIDRQAIEESGARTVQDLLAYASGVVLYDQVGNGIGTTLDLRGFAGGTGTRVLLDGAPLNDPRNNTVPMHLVPLSGLARVEILRGSTSATAGAGSEAGVIRLTTLAGDENRGSISAAATSDHGTELDGSVTHTFGRWSTALYGSRQSDDGFRQNAGGTLRRVGGSVGLDLHGDRRVELALIDSRSAWGTPGALTPGELDSDPYAAPHNLLDHADETLRRATVNYGGSWTDTLHVAANVFAGDRSSTILTTGRAAEDFGGFLLGTDTSERGATAQLTHDRPVGHGHHALTIGAEWLEGATDAAGFVTDPDAPGEIDPDAYASVNGIDRNALGLFVRERYIPAPRWTIVAGARFDRDRVRYDESTPDPSNGGSKAFDEISLRAGTIWTPSPRHETWISYGEAFLPPTVEELFAFPLFGSNADLRPEDSRSWEAGYRGRLGDALALDAALFLVDTRDEIVFDPTSDLGSFGANVNAGRTRRTGVEASLRARPTARLHLFATASLIDAEFREGENRGARVPLVPDQRYSAGFRIELPGDVRVTIDALRVGEQVLDNDDGNTQGRLDAYTVTRAYLVWRLPVRLDDGARVEAFAEVRNALDASYATRGIFSGQAYVTPAPDRRYAGGLRLAF